MADESAGRSRLIAHEPFAESVLAQLSHTRPWNFDVTLCRRALYPLATGGERSLYVFHHEIRPVFTVSLAMNHLVFLQWGVNPSAMTAVQDPVPVDGRA